MSTRSNRCWMGYSGLAKYTGGAVSTMYRLVSEGKGPPSVGYGRGRRFHPDDVDMWMETRHEPAELEHPGTSNESLREPAEEVAQ